MAKTQSDSEVVKGEVFGPAPPQPGRRRYYTVEEKRRFVEEARSPGSGVSTVARKYGVSASQLFRWRRLAEAGALEAMGADEAVVPESEVRQLRNQIRELERQLGKKTMENEILKEAIELTRSKKPLLRSRSHEPGGGE